jgi:hypothetical protein
MVLELLARIIKTGARNKMNSNGKRRSPTIPICRQYDLIPKKSQKFTPKALEITNHFWQCSKI